MNISLRFSYIYLFIFFSLFSCNNVEKPVENQVENTNKDLPPQTFAYFVQQTKEVESGTVIPFSLHQKFIQPSLVNEALHPYIASEKASYTYGEILHEDPNMVAFTFYYKAAHLQNLLAASFMATYNPVTEEFIDCKMVFGSSTFNFQKEKGYNLGFSCRSDMEFIESDELVLIIKSQIKHFYSAFKEEIEPRANSVNTHRYTLLKDGRFLFG